MDTNRKRLLLLAGALAIIAVFWGAARFLTGVFTDRSRLIPIRIERIKGIRFAHRNSAQTLTLNKGRWTVAANGNEYPADAARIDSLITSIADLSKDTIVSRNPVNHAKFGIGNDKMTVRADTEYTVYLGAMVGDDRYVRLGNGNEVYLARDFAGVSSLADYRDLNLRMVSDGQAVASITLRKNDSSFTLAKRGNTWFAGDSPANAKHVAVYLDALKDTRAVSVAGSPPGSGNPEYLAITVREQGSEKTVVFYERDDTTLVAKNTSVPYFFVVPRVYAASLDKTLEEFIEEPKARS